MHRHTNHDQEDLKLSIFDSVHLLPQTHWETLAPETNVYMSLPYLRALEGSLGDKIDFRYILFYNNDFQPVGIAVVQLLRFSGKELNTKDLHTRFGHFLSDKLLNNLDARVLLCGNAFSTGENGFAFCSSVPNDTAKTNLSRALDRIKRDEKKANNGVSIILLKDFWPASFDQLKSLKADGYTEFMIDVNMVVHIKPNWNQFDDYMEDLVTKFRTKVKGIYKKSEQIQSRILSATDIEALSDDINQLYGNVLERVDYRFGELTATTFQRFAEALPELFRLTGYFFEEKLVGFSTCFKSEDVLDANFVGINYDLNHSHAIYQRMLCDFIKYAIECGAKELRLGRTAEEMKSTLGAEPIEMKLYVKHKNHITNKLVKPIVSQITPSKFELRKPFKAVLYQK
ncbi:MAG: putative N-acyltransferase [Bacteroidia bacterium]|jgi:predicted N-acyltransferase